MITPQTLGTNSPLTSTPVDYCPEGSAKTFTILSGVDTGKRLFYFDHQVGSGEPESTIVFVHGNPESSYTYRDIRDSLMASGQSMRLIAMDHIGFGLSDQADFEMVDMHHAHNLRELIRHLDLSDVTLVVHDWGGPIGIGAFTEDHWRVRNLLVMNTTIFPMPPDSPTYADFPSKLLPWSRTPRVVPHALWGGMAAYVVAHAEPQPRVAFYRGAVASMVTHARKRFEPGSAEALWSDQFRSKANARSSLRNVRQTPFWGHGYRYQDTKHGIQDNHDFYQAMQHTVPREWGPTGRDIDVAGFFGGWDACGKQSVIDQWCDALPRIRDNLFRFPEHGHFIEEYKGPEMAQSILQMNGQDH